MSRTAATVFIAAVCAMAPRGASLAQDVPVTNATPRNAGSVEWLPSGVRNTTLGFTAPYPGAGFVVPAELQSQFDAQATATKGALVWWVFQRSETGEMVLLQAINAGQIGATESGLRSMAKGMRGNTTGTIIEDTLIWNESVTEFRFSSIRPDQMYLRYRCVASGSSRPEPLVVCLGTVTPEPASLDSMRLGLRLTSIP